MTAVHRTIGATADLLEQFAERLRIDPGPTTRAELYETAADIVTEVRTILGQDCRDIAANTPGPQLADRIIAAVEADYQANGAHTADEAKRTYRTIWRPS